LTTPPLRYDRHCRQLLWWPVSLQVVIVTLPDLRMVQLELAAAGASAAVRTARITRARIIGEKFLPGSGRRLIAPGCLSFSYEIR
jgi:hypothetical protein